MIVVAVAVVCAAGFQFNFKFIFWAMENACAMFSLWWHVSFAAQYLCRSLAWNWFSCYLWVKHLFWELFFLLLSSMSFGVVAVFEVAQLDLFLSYVLWFVLLYIDVVSQSSVSQSVSRSVVSQLIGRSVTLNKHTNNQQHSNKQWTNKQQNHKQWTNNESTMNQQWTNNGQQPTMNQQWTNK